MSTYLYLLYDGRAHNNVDDATVLDTAHTKEEAKKIWKENGRDGLVVKYKVVGEDNSLIEPEEMYEFFNNETT